MAYLPYVAGVSERIRKVCRDFNIRMVLMSGPTLRSLLTKVKDPLPTTKQSNVVYEVPSTCGKVYIGETKRRLETRLKENKDACTRCLTDKSAIAEHAWANNHPINWANTKILQRANRTMELVMKEALSISTTPEDARFNRDNVYELPDCWIATFKKLKGGASLSNAHRITPYKHTLESAKVNVVGKSRSYAIVWYLGRIEPPKAASWWYLLPRTCTVTVCSHVHHARACACTQKLCRVVNPRA